MTKICIDHIKDICESDGMTPPVPQDEKGVKDDFKQALKVWLKENGFTQKELSLYLGVTYGTVRNWFSSDSSISEKYKERIVELMNDPAMFRGTLQNKECLCCLNIRPFKANMPMWRSAAMVKDVSFSKEQPMGQEAVQFAKWATPIINRAIRQEVRKHSEAEIRELAAHVRFYNDPVAEIDKEPEDYFELSEEEREREEQGVPVRLPVLQGAINTLFWGIAAKAAKIDSSDFIAEALNAEADADFAETVQKYLEQDDDDGTPL